MGGFVLMVIPIAGESAIAHNLTINLNTVMNIGGFHIEIFPNVGIFTQIRDISNDRI
jgi:hypothetical protein